MISKIPFSQAHLDHAIIPRRMTEFVVQAVPQGEFPEDFDGNPMKTPSFATVLRENLQVLSMDWENIYSIIFLWLISMDLFLGEIV